MQSNHHHQSGLILPPLPPATFQNQPIPPRGPNPYALQPTTQHNVYQQHQQHPYGMSFEPNIEKINTFIAPDFEYRAERLAKQRQSVVGGSLFSTSPRSFLMGKKIIA